MNESISQYKINQKPLMKLNESDPFPNFQKDFLSRRQAENKIERIFSGDELHLSNMTQEMGFKIHATLSKDYEVGRSENSLRPPTYIEKNKPSKINFDDNNSSDKKGQITDSNSSPKSPQSAARRKKTKKVKMELELGNMINNEKEKQTLATNVPNDKLLDDHLQAENSTVIPFVKKFLHKLRNSTSNRDVNQLKEVNFQILNDKSYFYKEEKISRAMSSTKGVELFALKARNIYWELKFIIRTSMIISTIKSFIKSNFKVLHPYQNFKILWDILHLIMIIFWFFYLPLLVGFFEANYYSTLYLKTSLLFFGTDIVITLNSAYFKSGVLETKRAAIFANYFRKRFLKDVIALLPMFVDYFIKMHLTNNLFDCIETLAKNSCPINDDEETLEFLTLLRKLNFVKLLIYIKLLDFKLIYSRIMEKFLIQEKYQNIISLIKIAFISLLFAHIIGCFWHFIAEIQFPEISWLSVRNLESSPWLQRYLYSIYWASVTIMTVGYGDIVPQNNSEVLLALATIIFGCGVYAFNLNSIGMILQDINKENTRFKHNINIINQFMKRKNVNPDLQMRVREYLRFIWKEEKAQNLDEETHIINVLSGNLKEELLLEAYGEILRKYPVFYANFSEKALKKTVSHIKDCKYIPEETIYDEGAVDDQSIYFIMKGEVEIFANMSTSQKENPQPTSKKEIPLRRLQAGDFFGEIGFFTGAPRNASARSTDFTTLFSIKRNDFIGILRSHECLLDDYDKFCMIKDQILLYENLNSLRLRCFSCNQLGHLSNTCALIHYIPDQEKIIKTHNFQIDQERGNYFRNKFKQNALLHRRKIEESAMNFRAELIKFEENKEKIKHKNLKYLMRNLTGRIIFEEDSSIEENEDEDETSYDQSAPQQDVNSNIYENDSNLPIEENDKKTCELVPTNPIENVSTLKNSNNSPINLIENEDSRILNKSDYVMKESQEVANLSHFGYRNSRLDIMEKSSIIVTQSPKRNSLALQFKPSPKYRHSALATVQGKFFDEEKLMRERGELDTSNSKRKKMGWEPAQIALNPSQKSILKNPLNNNDMPSLNSLPKVMRASAISKKQYFDSSSMLPEFDKSSTKKTEEVHKQSHASSTTLNAIPLDELIKTLECFEKARNYKNYFPDNNLNKLIANVNSPDYSKKSLQDKLSKLQRLTKRLSKYTFFSTEMRNKMPEVIMKRIRSSKGSKFLSVNNETPTAQNNLLLQSPEKKTMLSPGITNQKQEFFGGMKLSNKMKFVDLAQILIKNGDLRKGLKKKKKFLFF